MGMPGSQRAVQKLVEEHYVALYRYAYRLSGSAADAEDLTQEPFCKAQLNLRQPRLTAAMLETLAVIAYRQPVGRAEIEEIRGVSASGVLRTLQERGLIEVTGRSEGLGRPLLYGTTPFFLELLGLPDLQNLPRAEELTIALQPSKPEVVGPDDAEAYVAADR